MAPKKNCTFCVKMKCGYFSKSAKVLVAMTSCTEATKGGRGNNYPQLEKKKAIKIKGKKKAKKIKNLSESFADNGEQLRKARFFGVRYQNIEERL